MELNAIILLYKMLLREYERLTNYINNAIDKEEDFEAYRWLDRREELIYIVKGVVEILEKCNIDKERYE